MQSFLDLFRHRCPQISMCSLTERLSNPFIMNFMNISWHNHDWLNNWLLVIYSTSKPPPLPGNQGLQIPTLCCSVLKSHLIYINPVVVERGLLKITFHFYGSEAISGTEDRRPNPVSHCSSDSRNFKGLGIYEQRSLDKNQKYVENIFWSSELANTCFL